MNQRKTYFLISMGSLAFMIALIAFIFVVRARNAIYEPVEAFVEVTSKNFEKEVVDSKLPVFVEFYVQDDCTPCRKEVAVINKVLPDYAGKVKFVRIEAQNQSGISKAFGITVVPSHVLLRLSDGLASVHQGFLDEAGLRKFLDEELAAQPPVVPPPPDTTDPAQPDPDPAAPVPAPVTPDPAPVNPEPAPVTPEPAPVNPEPAPVAPESGK